MRQIAPLHDKGLGSSQNLLQNMHDDTIGALQVYVCVGGGKLGWQ